MSFFDINLFGQPPAAFGQPPPGAFGLPLALIPGSPFGISPAPSPRQWASGAQSPFAAGMPLARAVSPSPYGSAPTSRQHGATSPPPPRPSPSTCAPDTLPPPPILNRSLQRPGVHGEASPCPSPQVTAMAVPASIRARTEAPPAGNATGPGDGTRGWDSTAQALSAFYKIYAPDRAAHVDSIVQTFGSDIVGLNRCLRAKYGASLPDLTPPNKAASATSTRMETQPQGETRLPTFREPEASSQNSLPRPKTPLSAHLNTGPQPPLRTSSQSPEAERQAPSIWHRAAKEGSPTPEHTTGRYAVDKPEVRDTVNGQHTLREPVSLQSSPPSQPSMEEKVRIVGICGCCGYDVMSSPLPAFDGGCYYHQVCLITCQPAISTPLVQMNTVSISRETRERGKGTTAGKTLKIRDMEAKT